MPSELEVPDLLTSPFLSLLCDEPAPWRQHPISNATLLENHKHSLSNIFHQSLAEAKQLLEKQPEPRPKRWRRRRTVFTQEELSVLESVYFQNKFLNPDLKAEILSKVNVPGNVIVMWFQNRRAKDRSAGIVI